MPRARVVQAVVKECSASSAGRAAAAVGTCLPPIVQ